MKIKKKIFKDRKIKTKKFNPFEKEKFFAFVVFRAAETLQRMLKWQEELKVKYEKPEASLKMLNQH